MKIIFANYRYFVSGGPERYMFGVTDALNAHGHEIIPFSINYTKNQPSLYSEYFVDPLGNRDEVKFREQRFNTKTLWRTLIRLFYAKDIENAIKRLVSETQPEVAYVLHYLRKLSPSLLVGLKKANIPIVVRLSDYAMVCPQAHCLRLNCPCELCVKGSLWPSIRHNCVQDSLAASTLNALATWFHRARHYFDLIDVFVTTNHFMYQKMLDAGFSKSRLQCIPTFTDVEAFKPKPDSSKGKYILYAGRIEEIKGVHVLIDALGLLHKRRPSLEIQAKILGAGDRRYRNSLEKSIKQLGIENMIEFVGEVDLSKIAILLGKSFLSIVPSLWYENLPNSILESYACGTPVLASDIGSLRECVKNGETGFLFGPGDPVSLAQFLEYCFDHPDEIRIMGRHARRIAEQKYSPEKHISALENLFEQLIECRKG